MISVDDDDGFLPPLDRTSGPLTTSSERTSTKLFQRADIVNGECLACVSVLTHDQKPASLSVLLDINGDTMPVMFGFCGNQSTTTQFNALLSLLYKHVMPWCAYTPMAWLNQSTLRRR